MAKKKHFQVFRSSAGLGLRALKDFKKGKQLLEYTGTLIRNEDIDGRVRRYLFELDDTHTIDGSPRSNLARYINHACKPNAQAVHHEAEGKIMIESTKAIKAGDEITYNYGKEYFERYIQPAGCKCATCEKRRRKGQ